MGEAESKASLGLAMIMKNEALNLAKSLAPAAELFDELVVVDTGSTDQSRDIALGLGAKVLDFKWVNDFAAARNFGLLAAQTDFIFWLDADNYIDPDSVLELRRHLKKGLDIILWATELVTPQGDRIWQKRVFPNRPAEVYFQGRVHEQLVNPPSFIQLATEAQIIHWGYAEALSAKQKGERNLELLLGAPETKAGDFYWLYQTGRTLYNLRRYQEAVDWLKRASATKNENLSLWAHSLILLSHSYSRLGCHDLAEASARRLAAEADGYGPGLYHLGRLLYDQGQLKEAGELLEAALILGTGDKVWGADPRSCNYRAAFLLGRIWSAEGLRQPARQAFELAGELDPANPEPPFALAQMALDDGDRGLAKNFLRRVLSLAPSHRRAAAAYKAVSEEGGGYVEQ